MLTKELTTEQQQEILYTLFGFNLQDEDNDKHFVLYDDEGYEFYGNKKIYNLTFQH